MEKIKPSELKLNFSSELFFDTNVWLFLFGQLAGHKKDRQKEYSILFENALQKNCSIHITSMIISEFANVILRDEFRKWSRNNKQVNPKYKDDFVGTETYKEKVKTVTAQLNKILSLPNIIKQPDSFNSISLDKIFTNFGLADFNDAYINEVVNSKSLILVTDDGDFEDIFTGKTLVSMS